MSTNWSAGNLVLVQYGGRTGSQIAEVVRWSGRNAAGQSVYQVRKWRANSKTWVGDKSRIFVTDGEILGQPSEAQLKKAGWTGARRS
jgi:hypothetical protein